MEKETHPKTTFNYSFSRSELAGKRLTTLVIGRSKITKETIYAICGDFLCMAERYSDDIQVMDLDIPEETEAVNS